VGNRKQMLFRYLLLRLCMKALSIRRWTMS
jgi:hypothetical protein